MAGPSAATAPAVAQITGAEHPDLFAGRVIVIRPVVRTTGVLTAQQQSGTRARASADPPAPDALSGRVAVGRWGLAQPVTRPTPPAIASPESPRPEPGRVWRPPAGPPFDNRLPARPVVARPEAPPPDPGRAVVGPVGFGVPRRPVVPVVVSPEVRAPAPAPGSAVVARRPAGPLTPQQRPGVVRVAAAEPPPPFPGWAFCRARPLVPSDRLRTRPVVARTEDRPPEAGRAVACRVPDGHPPPARFALVVRGGDAPPFAGAVLSDGPAVPAAVVPQQPPGRVIVAGVEPPRPDEGRTVVLTGLRAGAVPPDLGCCSGE